MDCDVIVVGAGPAGLFLAAELQLSGIDCVVVEQRTEPDTEDKAHGLLGQAVRLLDARGLIGRAGEAGAESPAPAFFFAGLPLPLRDLGTSSPLYLLPINQADLERLLGDRATELGADIRRGWQVASFEQDEDQVRLRLRLRLLGPGGAEQTLTAAYLVGCDGARSLVRTQLGFAFQGSRDDRIVDRWAMVSSNDQLHVLDGGRVHIAGLGDIRAAFHRTEQGVFTILGRDPDVPIVNTAEWENCPEPNVPEQNGTPPSAPMSLPEMEDSVERVLGVRLALSAPPEDARGLLRRLRGRNTRLAEHYRDRRVFIAGDAAHTSHGPTLNLALQDVANLAWKLAATLHGWAPRDLLDTYESERRAAGEREVTWTQAETALMAPGPDVTALRALFGELLEDRRNLAAVASVMAGADTRYDTGEPPPAPEAGYFAPNLTLATEDGRSVRLVQLLHDARPLLLTFTSDNDLVDVASSVPGHVVHVSATASDPPAAAMLVRPDGYVVWSGSDPASLRAAVKRWFERS